MKATKAELVELTEALWAELIARKQTARVRPV